MTPLPHAFCPTDESHTDATPERRLMLATIVNALSDAISGGSSNPRVCERDQVRTQARAWFQNGDADFQTVCHLAGLEPASVRSAALRYIASGAAMPRIRREASSARSAAPQRFSVPVRDVARCARVSPQAVRNVLCGRGSASPDMQHRVRRAVRELTDQKEAA